MIWQLILRGLWKPILAALVLAATAIGVRKSAKTAAKLDRAKEALETHERINEADDLRNASDADRVKWLRDFAKRNGRS